MRRILSMPVRDLSSGFRLYKREAVQNLEFESQNFEIQEEILVKAYALGFSVIEVPFVYFPRRSGRSHARVLRFGIDLARESMKLLKIRNSVDSPDYNERAFYSIVQHSHVRYRRRHKIVLSWARGLQQVLSVQCGSSVLLQNLNNVIALDTVPPKIRFLRRYGIPLVWGCPSRLPFKNQSFDCVIGSEAVGHRALEEALLTEMSRVLRPGGTLILDAPDCGAVRSAEPILRSPANPERRAGRRRYTQVRFQKVLMRHGFHLADTARIGRGEIILKCCKEHDRQTACDPYAGRETFVTRLPRLPFARTTAAGHARSDADNPY